MTGLSLLSFPDALKRAQTIVSAEAIAVLNDRDDPLNQAMAYALQGGKALRGFLVVESARLFGIDAVVSKKPALAIECMHAYSLIHDDLPCMDDDDLRRGKPTLHKAWNEHTAVLAGDALQSLCFELLSTTRADPIFTLEMTRRMAFAAGRRGMVGGQMLDIQAESAREPFTLEQIIAVQRGKTGALIQWSAAAGAVMAGEDSTALETYGENLGLAFQIADDILDVEGDATTVGKAVGKDAHAGKATFVSLLGLDGAKRRAQDLVTQACDDLDIYGDTAECLRDAARFVIARQS